MLVKAWGSASERQRFACLMVVSSTVGFIAAMVVEAF